MKKSELKEIFLGILKPFFKEKGYAYQFEYISKFQLKTDKCVAMSYFDYLDNKVAIRGGRLRLCLWDVENIILEIQYPNMDFTCYLEKKNDFLITTFEKESNYKLGENNILDDEEKIIKYAETIKQYIETDGQKFIDHYSYLPNVLTEMDKLESEGKYWNNKGDGVLCGSLDAYFRGLIISRLCNDSDFKRKIEVMNVKFSQAGYESWQPYYEKLKKRLETLEPIYNI